MTYAFRFDASSCTGCKACQTACKDKNNLPVGVLWRRVYEISGGTWTHTGNSWKNTVFSYNLTISCNHCVHPKCAGVCPVDAYSIREDGIIHLDSSKCIGCGYCAWACPYDAPQYDPLSGTMMKCDFCSDDLAAGRPPACVAACPMRVLNVIEADNELVTESGVIPLWISPPTEHPYPLPVYSHTEPHLSIKLHPSMHMTDNKFLANKEEVCPGGYSTWKEFPLIVFTLLTQMAVGGFWFMSSIIAPLLVWPQFIRPFHNNLAFLLDWDQSLFGLAGFLFSSRQQAKFMARILSSPEILAQSRNSLYHPLWDRLVLHNTCLDKHRRTQASQSIRISSADCLARFWYRYEHGASLPTANYPGLEYLAHKCEFPNYNRLARFSWYGMHFHLGIAFCRNGYSPSSN